MYRPVKFKYGDRVRDIFDRTGIVVGRDKFSPNIVVVKIDKGENWSWSEDLRDRPYSVYTTNKRLLKEGDQCRWCKNSELEKVEEVK